jgi:hypothetical protein
MTNLGVNPLIRRIRIKQIIQQIQKHIMVIVMKRRPALQEISSRLSNLAHENGRTNKFRQLHSEKNDNAQIKGNHTYRGLASLHSCLFLEGHEIHCHIGSWILESA